MKGKRPERAIGIGFCAGILILLVGCSSGPVSGPWSGTAFVVKDVPAVSAPEKRPVDENTLARAPKVQWTPLPVEEKKKTAPVEPPDDGAENPDPARAEVKRPETVVEPPPVTPKEPPTEVGYPEKKKPATNPEPLTVPGRKAEDREKPAKVPGIPPPGVESENPV